MFSVECDSVLDSCGLDIGCINANDNNDQNNDPTESDDDSRDVNERPALTCTHEGKEQEAEEDEDEEMLTDLP